jgi:hypothetical protein
MRSRYDFETALSSSLDRRTILSGDSPFSRSCGSAEHWLRSSWPSHYDLSLPHGGKDGVPLYAKPGYKGVNLSLTCKEATGILKMRGYRDITELSCNGQIYRFEVSRVEGRFVIDIDPRTGDILRRQQL